MRGNTRFRRIWRLQVLHTSPAGEPPARGRRALDPSHEPKSPAAGPRIAGRARRQQWVRPEVLGVIFSKVMTEKASQNFTSKVCQQWHLALDLA